MDEENKRKPSQRGKARQTKQLSDLQKQILAYVAFWQGTLTSAIADETKRKMINQKGIRWSAKRFYNDDPTPSQSAALSRALHRLEARGLVVCYDATGKFLKKPRTTHVKITPPGMQIAFIASEATKAILARDIAHVVWLYQNPSFQRWTLP